MKTIAMALGSVSECGLCQVLMAHGGTTPGAVREFNELRERNGYCGKPAQGEDWVRLLEQHEADHLKAGDALPVEWTAKGIPQAFSEAYKAKPKPVRKATRRVLSDEELAILEFKAWARPVVHQRNGRKQADPVEKLDLTPFKGL